MHVFVDTNILYNDFYFKGHGINTLFEYLKKTRHKLILPQIVIDELVKKHNEVAEQYKEILEKQERILNIKKTKEGKKEVKYEQIIKQIIKENKIKILPYLDIHYSRIVQRSLLVKKPFKKEDKGFRDAIIWETLKDVVFSDDYNLVAFISNNTTQFANQNSELEESLIEELNGKSNKLLYFQTLSAFLQEYGEPLDKITSADVQECLQEEIDTLWMLDYFSDDRLREIYAGTFYRPVENIKIGSLELKNFFIYNKSKDGKYWIQAEGLISADVVYFDPIDEEEFSDQEYASFTSELIFNEKDSKITCKKINIVNVPMRYL